MRRAAGVEGCVAFGAAVGRFVGSDRQFGPAVAAEDGRLVELVLRPLLRGVVGGLGVAEVAGIVAVAAGEADGDDVDFGGVVDAPSVIVDRRAEYFGSPRHCSLFLPVPLLHLATGDAPGPFQRSRCGSTPGPVIVPVEWKPPSR